MSDLPNRCRRSRNRRLPNRTLTIAAPCRGLRSLADGLSLRLVLASTAALALSIVVWVDSAAAHGRSLSYSSWELARDGAKIQARITALDLSRLPLPQLQPGETDPVASYVATHLRLVSDGKTCPPADRPVGLGAASGWAVYEWRVLCPPGSRLQVETDLLLAENPAHLHFARARLMDGQVIEKVLAEGAPSWDLPRQTAADGRAPAAEPLAKSFVDFFALGVEHILTGWDHLAFVIALLLLARTLSEVATLVTAFTLAHSVTLGLAVLGMVRPEARAIEALIGFSIALVAAENAWLLAGRDRWVPGAIVALLAVLAILAAAGAGAVPALALVGLGAFSLCHFALLDGAGNPSRLRAAVAFAFGLVHGFGFAGVLAQMDLPGDRLATALAGFNLGVEAGQLAIVALAWPILRELSRRLPTERESLVAEVGSAGICGLGLYWFLTRALGAS